MYDLFNNQWNIPDPINDDVIVIKVFLLKVEINLQINVREYRKGNQKWTNQRKWQHWVHKMKNNTTQTEQYNICWTPLCASKHK